MRSVAAFAFLCLLSCKGEGKDEPLVSDSDGEEPSGTDVDTGWPPGDLANIHISYDANTRQTGVYAVFTESSPSFVNLAECAIEGSLCIPGFASDEDDFEELDPDLEIDQEATRTRFAGYEITLGPYTLPYKEDQDTKFGYYYLGSRMDLPTGWIGASWGGQWPEHQGTRDLFVSPPIEIIQPAINSRIAFTNGQTIPLEWVPTGEGTVTLLVYTRFTLSRMYQLEDDGYFALDADSLLLSGDSEALTFVFARWNESQIIDKGHVINLVASSKASFTGHYVQIGAREQVTPADECPEAEGSLPLEAGNWWGYLGGSLNNDLDPNNGCLYGGANYYADAAGNDGIFRIEVPGHHAVSVDYNLFDESASVYFMTDCSIISTCFDGADTSRDPNIHEFLNYFNPDDQSSAPKTIYLVVDATEPGGSVFTLDITNSELLEPSMYDACDQAEAPPPEHVPVESANYYADFVAYTDDLNPGAGGCTDTSLPGPDSLTPITLQSQETLTVSVDMPGGDPALYLLYNCRDEFTCPVGADKGGVGDIEQIVYQNTGAGTENLHIVVDSKTGLRPYFLSVSIN